MLSITRSGLAAVTFAICAVAFGALLANAAVLYAFIKSRQLRKPSNYFAVNLAVTDVFIIAGALALWLLIEWHNYEVLVFKSGMVVPLESLTHFYKFWTLLDSTLMNISVSNLAILSAERYFAIAKPIFHRLHFTPKRAKFTCIIIWPLSLMIMGPIGGFEIASNKKYILKAIPVSLCCLIVLISYALLLKNMCGERRLTRQGSVRQRSARKGSARQINPRQYRAKRTEFKLSLRLSLLTVVFIVCWIPVTVFSFWVAGHKNQSSISPQVLFLVLAPLLKLLSYVSVVLNPFLYVFGRPAFIRVLKKEFCCRRGCRLERTETFETKTVRSGSTEIAQLHGESKL